VFRENREVRWNRGDKKNRKKEEQQGKSDRGIRDFRENK
jgi:hypothetical protein